MDRTGTRGLLGVLTCWLAWERRGRANRVLFVATLSLAVFVTLVAVTMLATIIPARRAMSIPPIAAVREGATLPPGGLTRHGPAAYEGIPRRWQGFRRADRKRHSGAARSALART